MGKEKMEIIFYFKKLRQGNPMLTVGRQKNAPVSSGGPWKIQKLATQNTGSAGGSGAEVGRGVKSLFCRQLDPETSLSEQLCDCPSHLAWELLRR